MRFNALSVEEYLKFLNFMSLSIRMSHSSVIDVGHKTTIHHSLVPQHFQVDMEVALIIALVGKACIITEKGINLFEYPTHFIINCPIYIYAKSIDCCCNNFLSAYLFIFKNFDDP